MLLRITNWAGFTSLWGDYAVVVMLLVFMAMAIIVDVIFVCDVVLVSQCLLG